MFRACVGVTEVSRSAAKELTYSEEEVTAKHTSGYFCLQKLYQGGNQGESGTRGPPNKLGPEAGYLFDAIM